MRSLLVSLLLLAIVGTQRQTTASNDQVYDPVPNDQRVLLKHALAELVDAERGANWKSVFALIDHEPGETEESFVDKMRHARRLKDFSPSKISFYPPSESWLVTGCAVFGNAGNGEGEEANVHARWEGSRWYLSVVAIQLIGPENKTKTRHCSIP